MWIIYLDTSALLKRYIQEAGAEEVRQLLERADEVATGLITRVETASAVARLVRSHAITEEEGEESGMNSPRTGRSSPVCISHRRELKKRQVWRVDMHCGVTMRFTWPAPSCGRND
jgi:predicted nucleic acid-binding protein